MLQSYKRVSRVSIANRSLLGIGECGHSGLVVLRSRHRLAVHQDLHRAVHMARVQENVPTTPKRITKRKAVTPLKNLTCFSSLEVVAVGEGSKALAGFVG